MATFFFFLHSGLSAAGRRTTAAGENGTTPTGCCTVVLWKRGGLMWPEIKRFLEQRLWEVEICSWIGVCLRKTGPYLPVCQSVRQSAGTDGSLRTDGHVPYVYILFKLICFCCLRQRLGGRLIHVAGASVYESLCECVCVCLHTCMTDLGQSDSLIAKTFLNLENTEISLKNWNFSSR